VNTPEREALLVCVFGSFGAAFFYRVGRARNLPRGFGLRVPSQAPKVVVEVSTTTVTPPQLSHSTCHILLEVAVVVIVGVI
jgi:hypothetical protein